MVRPVKQVSICLSLEEVTMRTDDKVFIEVYYIMFFVGDPQEILDLQL